MKTSMKIVLVLLIGIVAFVGYYGAFSKIEFQETEFGPLRLVYEDHVGDYYKVGSVIEKVCTDLGSEFHANVNRGFGIYYDDPKDTPKEKLRAKVGCVLEDADMDKAGTISGKYKIMDVPRRRSLVAEFPYRGMPSIYLGIIKAYPALSKLMEEKGYPKSEVMEVYDMAGKKIFYVKVL